MARTIRFHLDEHANPAVADALRRRGIDVTTTPEAGLPGADDAAHLAFALEQLRVIFSNDADFLRLHDANVEHAVIAYCHQQSRSVGEIVRMLEMNWEVFETEEMQNHVEFI